MRIGLRLLKPETVRWLRRELQRGELRRAALGRGLCERDEWRNRQGRLCAASARKALPRLAGDWERVHGVRPVLLETCVEASRRGTSYQAAGWQCVGQTAGRPPGSAAAVEPKSVWLRGLQRDWEAVLRRPPQRELGRFPALELEAEASWARCEFARSELADGRLRARLEQMAAAWERHPGQPLPGIFRARPSRRRPTVFCTMAR